MKHTIAGLLALLIALMMVLSGCNLVQVDPKVQLAEDLELLKKDYATVLGTYDGGEITKEDVIAMFLYQYSYYEYLYSMMGATIDDAALESMKMTAIESYVQILAIDKQFDVLGLSFTEEEMAEIQAQAESNYQATYDYYYEMAAGDTEEIKAKQAELNLYADGYTQEVIYSDTFSQAKYYAVQDYLFSQITEVSEEELKTAYETKVESDEQTYEGDARSFETDMAAEGTMVFWMPEGYRTVKHILLKPEEEAMNAVTAARSALEDAEYTLETLRAEMDALNDEDAEDAAEEQRSAEEIQADIDQAEAGLPELKAAVESAEAACIASVQDKLDEIYAKIEAGEDFDALMAQYGEDPGMQREPAMTIGYYVSNDSAAWDPNFTAGAMVLENIGDVSEKPAISSSGIHIIRYESDVTPGAVPFEEVRETLKENTLMEKRYADFDSKIAQWTDEMNAQYDLNAFTF